MLRTGVWRASVCCTGVGGTGVGALVFAAPALGAPAFGAPVFGALVFVALVFVALVSVALVFVALRPGDLRDARGTLTRRMFSRVLRSKCPPSDSVESADAARRPVGSRRCGHRCPHTFCPLTDTVKC